MNKKRKSIRNKVQKIVLLLCVISLLLTSAVGLYSMFRIKGNSESALTTQMEQNLKNLVSSRASLADSKLEKYSDYVSNFAAYINLLYKNPSAYVPKEVLPPDAKNAGVYSMQRYPAREDISIESIRSEIALLGNLEQIWSPIVSDNSDIISTIYIGTESGFHISYDTRADLGAGEAGAESYYDYFFSSWYTTGKEADGVFFTDVYPDSYGRGLTLTCASPFFDASDKFAGVVCMDILVTDLHSSIIDIDLGEGSYAFLVDRKGDIIASPFVTLDQKTFDNILKPTEEIYSVAADIMNGETGVSLASNGTYYAYAPISGTDWKLCISIPKSLILAPVDAVSHNILVAIIIFIAAFIAIIIVVYTLVARFSTSLTKPLLALRNDAKTISLGNLDHKADVHSNDEIGDVATAFNDMAAALKDYINNLTAVTAEKERIGAELDVATQIQSSMLPCIFPAFPERSEFDVYATMTPAKEVGGDFYDFFMVDDRHLAIVIADVSGKGVPAALFMVIGKTLIKDHTHPGRDLGEIFSRVNNLLCESNSAELFITAFEGVLDLVTGEFRFVNAGHEMPYISKRGEKFEAYKIRPGFVLAGMEGINYKGGSLILEPGDKLFQYTDGVTEATNSDNELYGASRLEQVLNTVIDRAPNEILPAVEADINKFVGEAPQFDDITMLCLEYKSYMKETNDTEVSQ